MSSGAIAHLEHKKDPFLKALIRSGKIAPATRAVRISRDAVYDWLRVDPAFRRKFNEAKKQKFNSQTTALSQALDIFLAVTRPIVTPKLYTRIVAATNLTLSNRQFKDGATVNATSRKRSRPSSFDVFPESANSVNAGGRVGTKGKNESLT